MGADADIIRRLTDEVYLAGNLDLLDELIADDFVTHDPPPGLPADKEGVLVAARGIVEALTDRRAELDEIVETTDGRVVQNFTLVATHKGELFGIPASGKEIRLRGIEISRCAGGKVVESWGAYDMTDLLEKAGVLGS